MSLPEFQPPRTAAHQDATLTLKQRVDELVAEHGGLRKAATVLRIDPGYLSRLRSGEKENPDDELLTDMGLRRVVSYERLVARAAIQAAGVAPSVVAGEATALQALDALEALEGSARGDEPFNHAAAPLIRAYIEASIATPPAAAGAAIGWQPIETAPKGRTLLVGYTNRAGKWRTVRGHYYLPQTLELGDDYDGDAEDGFAPEGWYEEVENSETINFTDEPPTRWMPLPAAPTAPSGD